MAQRTYDPDLVSAPPDDGGDLGIFSRPEDSLQVRDPAAPRGEKYPPSDQDPSRSGSIGKRPTTGPTAGLGVAGMTIFFMAIAALAVVLALLVLGG